MLSLLIFVIAGYLSGSVLYSKLIAQHILKVDISTVGDGNPGMTNVAKIGGAKWAAVAFILDCSKAAVPVGIAYVIFGIQDWRIFPIGFAPALGHAYPIFNGFEGGGKAIAAVAGAWVGIAQAEMILVGAGLLTVWFFIVEESAWAAIFMVLSNFVYMAIMGKPLLWHAFMFATLIFFLWTHRHSLRNPPGLKPWITRLWQRQS